MSRQRLRLLHNGACIAESLAGSRLYAGKFTEPRYKSRNRCSVSPFLMMPGLCLPLTSLRALPSAARRPCKHLSPSWRGDMLHHLPSTRLSSAACILRRSSASSLSGCPQCSSLARPYSALLMPKLTPPLLQLALSAVTAGALSAGQSCLFCRFLCPRHLSTCSSRCGNHLLGLGRSLLCSSVAIRLGQIVDVKDNPDLKTTTGTHCNLLAVAQVFDVDLEAIAAWTWVVVRLERLVVGHVLAASQSL